MCFSLPYQYVLLVYSLISKYWKFSDNLLLIFLYKYCYNKETDYIASMLCNSLRHFIAQNMGYIVNIGEIFFANQKRMSISSGQVTVLFKYAKLILLKSTCSIHFWHSEINLSNIIVNGYRFFLSSVNTFFMF